MVDELISLNLEENILRFAKAKNAGGKIQIDLLSQQGDIPSFYDSDTKKVIDDVTEVIKKSITTLKLNKRKVNIVIPDGFTYSQLVYMPRLKEKELLSAIKYQADQFIPMPIEDTSLDLEIIHEDKLANKLLVLVVASPQKLIEKIQNVSEQVGFYPEAIENELSATGRFLVNFYQPANQEGGTIFINFGYSSTSFYFFDHKLRLLTDSHTFPAGLAIFLREAQADINIDLAKAKNLLKKIGFLSDPTVNFNEILQPTVDALSAELQKFINSVRTKFQISSIGRLLMFNLASEINNLAKKIESQISIPTAIFDPLPSTNRTSAVEPFIKDLSSFISVIGGSLA